MKILKNRFPTETFGNDKKTVRHCEEQQSCDVAIFNFASNPPIFRRSGFTLVELVITIAIVIVLSTISVPIYKNYLYNAKISEGYTLLAAIRDAQMAYYDTYGHFLGEWYSSAGASRFTCNEEVLGINAIGNKYFTSFSVGDTNFKLVNELCYGFAAAVKMPLELRRNSNNDSYLVYVYNKTEGAKFAVANRADYVKIK